MQSTASLSLDNCECVPEVAKYAYLTRIGLCHVRNDHLEGDWRESRKEGRERGHR